MVNAIWTGKYPTYCRGEWILEIDGKNVSDRIPDEYRYDCPMGTFGKYEKWYLSDYQEKWETYKDGMKERIWIRENSDWLNNITADPEVQKEIFKAIQKQDWRYGCCGGCI